MSRELPRSQITFDGPNIIVCEGYSDVRFLKQLLNVRGIIPFEIGCPTQAQDGIPGEGRTGIPEYLTAVRVFGTQAANGLQSVAIMMDADDDPETANSDAASWLADAGFPAPDRVCHWTDNYDDIPRTAILIIPGSSADGDLRSGTLEHLLWDVVKDTSPGTFKCVEDFASCVGGHADWSENKKAKMRVHSAIASRCKADPASSLSRVWSKDPNIFPLDHSTFDFIADLFRSLNEP